jgi:hypothetical protein
MAGAGSNPKNLLNSFRPDCSGRAIDRVRQHDVSGVSPLQPKTVPQAGVRLRQNCSLTSRVWHAHAIFSRPAIGGARQGWEGRLQPIRYRFGWTTERRD